MARVTIGPIVSELDEIIAYSGLMVPDTLDNKALESTDNYDSFEISDSSLYVQGERLDDNVELF